MFEITRDTLTALLAIAAKDDPRAWMNAVYFYADGFNSYAVAVNMHCCAVQSIGVCAAVKERFGIPILHLEAILFISKKARDRKIKVFNHAITCGEVEILFNRVDWAFVNQFEALSTPPDGALLGPGSGNYKAKYLAQISDLLATDDSRYRYLPVPIRTDFTTLSGYVDTGKTKACIMGVRV
jgi:hypothetical protein